MLRIQELRLPLQEHSPQDLHKAVAQRLHVSEAAVQEVQVFKRSVDARKKNALTFIYTLDVVVANEDQVLKARYTDKHLMPSPDTRYAFVGHAPVGFSQPRPVVIGFGPCGIFAALLLAQMGFKPLVLERGKAVRERTKDTWGLWRKRDLQPESNVQFGEGGAGTFSDGKLYSQIKDPRHLGRKVLTEFVKAGAPEEILYVSKPHIGTFRLVKMVENMRAEIIALGGEIRFGQQVTDLHIEQGRVQGLSLASGERLAASHVIMALGHSARDTFAMLYERGVFMQAKPFAVGFRVEHPQSLIDQARLGAHAGNPLLGAADYKLVHHASNGRAVYSFCMCPGGTVVAATSEAGRVVTNGMSQYSRAERNANAGIVVNINPEDFSLQGLLTPPPVVAHWPLRAGVTIPRMGGAGTGDEPSHASTQGDALTSVDDAQAIHPLAGIAFQRHWESRAYELGGQTYDAPGQLVGDFIAAKPSRAFGQVMPSYKPGVHLTDLATALPDYAIQAMREAFPAFGQKISGFDRADAVLTGVETRTSSPLRITRGEDFQSLNITGLYPAGEGAGYAGGILSAGVDGIRVAEAVAKSLLQL